MRSSKFQLVVLILVTIGIFTAVARGVVRTYDARVNDYYRGVFDLCMNQAFYERGLPLFDSIQECKALVKDAKGNQWFEQVSKFWK